MSEPIVGVVTGSNDDVEVMREAVDVLADEFGIGCEVRILSGHDTPDELLEWARTASERGLKVVIAGASSATHLPAILAGATSLPVIGVPCRGGNVNALDALLATAQMPDGVPVATVGVDAARNAGLLAARILGTSDQELRAACDRFRDERAQELRDQDTRVREQFDRVREGKPTFGFTP